MKFVLSYILLGITALGFLFPAKNGLAQQPEIAVLLSREIAPYVAMVEGLESELSNQTVQRFFLDQQGRVYSLSGGSITLDPDQFQALVAVGPRALRYFNSYRGNVPIVFGMVLNPQKIISDITRPLCGVSLNIPIKAEFISIQQNFPQLTSLGVLYDPANNQLWIDRAKLVADTMGITLLPLKVTHHAGRLTVLGDLSAADAILFIPDKTIISKTVIRYFIKQAVLLRTPVIGYNQFFYDSGAALNFRIDYTKVGQQVAGQVRHAFSGRICRDILPPAFDALRNEDTWRVLQLPVPEDN